ncbi:Poly(U)-binding-splicing factor puf60 [Entophlyctis luteolus]|nr:Poly(U)-binding-splicing factor puf60 [Entophlyctis luteolus]
MSNLEHYRCNGTRCVELGHEPLTIDTFNWENLVDKNGSKASRADLADVVIVFISKGWCKYCGRMQVSPILSNIHAHNSEKISLVIQNHSFVEIPYQEDGFQKFMREKEFYNLNYEPKSEEDLANLRKMLRDHCIEFPAFFVFQRESGKLLTNDGYTIIKSLYDLSKDYDNSSCDACREFSKPIDLEFWTRAGAIMQPQDAAAKALLESAKAFARAQTIKLLLSNSTADPASTDATATSADTHGPAVTAMSLAAYATALQFPASFSQQTISAVYAASKIYVGALHPDIEELHLRQLFSVFGSIRSMSMSFDAVTGLGPAKHKGFAFFEFDCPESGVLAVQGMNGVEFGGRAMKVSRPKDFKLETLDLIPKAPVERIFVSNIHENVDEDMLKAIFDAFGEVDKVALLPDAVTRKHKGCGYIQFRDASAASTAVMSIQSRVGGGFELAGSRLYALPAVVGGEMMAGMVSLAGVPQLSEAAKSAATATKITAKSIVPSKLSTVHALPPNPMLSAAAAATAGMMHALPAESAAAQTLRAAIQAAKAKFARETGGTTTDADDSVEDGDVSIKSASARLAVMQKLMRREDVPVPVEDSMSATKRRKVDDNNEKAVASVSRSLVLRNMVTVEETSDPELETEILEECQKYGKVEKVDVGKVGDSENPNATVDVIVTFASHDDSEKTRAALDGRCEEVGRQCTLDIAFVKFTYKVDENECYLVGGVLAAMPSSTNLEASINLSPPSTALRSKIQRHFSAKGFAKVQTAKGPHNLLQITAEVPLKLKAV